MKLPAIKRPGRNRVIISSNTPRRIMLSFHNIWPAIGNVVTWTPALKLKGFSSEKSKRLFKEFQFTLYSTMLSRVLAGNVIFYALIFVVQLLQAPLGMEPFQITSRLEGVVGGILFHLAAFAIYCFFPQVFRAGYFFIILVSIVLNLYVGKYFYIPVPGTLVNTSCTILFLLMATIYFQNSTICLSMSCILQFIFNLASKTLLIARPSSFPGSVPITSEVTLICNIK